ncbi:mercuric reductase [Roseibium sp. TrichSKD4]|uniref:TVP38/TMEM64 family protein n=1 Tax=Roseibium sp. TrichSKD4 TaxID=744980 RepID=UPI0001E56C88|nr:TVP38/TMEM64 family protein [Roseibium sp. TrichSKD4]EFO33192.1 mercuric reductase [Roseibium sp. TrichSKD4]
MTIDKNVGLKETERTMEVTEKTSTQEGKSGSFLKAWGPLALLVAVMGFGFSQGWHEVLSLSTLIQERQSLISSVENNFLLSLGLFAWIYVCAVALSFPGASLLTISGGFLFGWIVGGAVTVLAASLGATIVFLIARSSFGEFLTQKAGPFVERLSEGFRSNAFHYLLFLRLTPVFPFWLVNIAPALFKVPLGTYAVSTALGILPGTFAFAFIGAGLDSVIEAQEAANPGCAADGTCSVEISALVTPELLAAFFVLGIASLIPVAIKRLRSA